MDQEMGRTSRELIADGKSNWFEGFRLLGVYLEPRDRLLSSAPLTATGDPASPSEVP
jgi:hypothetical protein